MFSVQRFSFFLCLCKASVSVLPNGVPPLGVAVSLRVCYIFECLQSL
jgi:hypothetical protein